MGSRKIRIGIRGAAGLLGSRLAAAIAKSEDMSLEVGVVLPDRTLQSTLDRCKILPKYRDTLPKRMFVQSIHTGRESDVVRRLNDEQDMVHFEGASQLHWKSLCDVIIDTAYPAGKETFTEQYRTFPGIILLQDGARPEGVLIAPPIVEKDSSSNVYRIGDCILSGIVPILHPLRKFTSQMRLHMVMQFDGREADYLITERAHAFYIREDLKDKITSELGTLFPQQQTTVQGVIQIPSLLHYQATLELKLRKKLSHDEVLKILGKMPRIRLIPQGISSTYEINLARSIEDVVPPIMVFESSLSPERGERSNTVRILAAIYYRTAAVLPNLDAIRILVGGMDPIVAMKLTDSTMGFTAPFEH